MTDAQIRAHVNASFWQRMGWFIVGAPMMTLLTVVVILTMRESIVNAVVAAYSGFLGIGVASALVWVSEKRELPSTIEDARQEIKLFGPSAGYAYMHRRTQKRYIVVCCAIDKRSCRAVVVHKNDEGEVFTRTLKDWREKDDRGTPRFIGL